MSGPLYLARLLTHNSLESLQREMRRLEVDKGGIGIMAAKGVQRLILLEQIPTAAANIIKQEILARGGDLVTPASAAGFELPFVDAVLIGSLTTLRSTVSKLYRQHGYDLPLIADAIQRVIVRTTPGYLPVAPRPNRQGVVVEETLEDLTGGRIPLMPGTNRAVGRPTLAELPGNSWQFGKMTYVMGMVEAAAAPSAQGGPDRDPGGAWRRIRRIADEGAQLIAIGGDGVVPLVARANAEYPDVVLCVRTGDLCVAEAAVAAGAQIIQNAGAGPLGPDLAEFVAQSGLPVVLTHGGDSPLPGDSPRSRDLMSDMARFFWTAMNDAARSRVAEAQIILDVGVGLGKTSAQDLELTRRLRELTSFGRPLLYGPALPAPESGPNGEDAPQVEPLPATIAAVCAAISGGADIIRVQHVSEIARSVKMTDALVRGSIGSDE